MIVRNAKWNLAITLALAGVCIVVGIGFFSITKSMLMRALLGVEAAKAGEVSVSQSYSMLRSGYVGDFGSVPTLPEAVDYEIQPHLPYSSLSYGAAAPRVETRISIIGTPGVPPAGAQPARVKRPSIRIGLYETTEAVKIMVNGRADIITEDGEVRKRIKKNRLVKIKYNPDTEQYIVRRGSWKLITDQAVRVVPVRGNKISTITNYENRPSWDVTLNDNEFYGTIEVNGEDVVNELKIENYLQGIAEAGDDNDKAYLKALMTAARTYVYYHYQYPTKYPDKPYLLSGTANDQVYRGYGFTKRAPNIVQAVKETRGRIVHYNGEPVVTPYYSKSDGRTRAWSEVWAGERAYLVSVADPCCVGEPLTGHGVGMSALGARWFAENENWGWKKILKYYYTDVTIHRLWR